ncbi:MAG: prepilin-type N-terminal cleavage/methylation domain-containing protein [Candidatus Omnitrophica bacterium]|nr:prepilin-type N-terminal cleavage/methylation domain-containing protein [Candidatus Omnitrophota bacterium]
MFKRKKSGFTLIELLIVIAIILILIAIALPNFLEAQIRARVTKANGELRSIATALFDYNTALISASKEGVFPPAGNVAQAGWTAWTNSAVFTPNGPNNNRHACSIIWVDRSFYSMKDDASGNDAPQPPQGTQHYDLRVMTSPIEAITGVPNDPFKNNGGFTAQYDYFGLDLRDTFVLRSLGPDGIAAVGCEVGGFDCACAEASCLVFGNAGKDRPTLSGRKFDPATDTVFGCDGCGTLSEALRVGSVVYSPTNGTKSDGDIFRFQQ